MKKVHLVEPLWRDTLIKQHTKDHKVLYNQHFQSFNQAFFNVSASENNKRLCEAIQLISTHKDAFPLLSKVLSYPQTIHQALQFLDECDQYQIDPHSIDAIDEVMKEKVSLLILLNQHIDYRPYRNSHIDKNSHYTLYPRYKQLYEQAFIDEHQIEVIESPTIKPQVKAYQALNRRQEIEALAQSLVHNEEEHLILCGQLSEYAPEIRRIFSTYQIDYKIYEQEYPALFLMFTHLVLYAHTGRQQHLIDYLSLLPHTKELGEYLETYQVDLFETFDHVTSKNISLFDESLQKQLLRHQELANTQKQNVLPNLQIDKTSLETLLMSVFEIVKKEGNHHEVLTLKNRLESIYDTLDSDNLELLLTTIINQPISSSKGNNHKILIADYRSFPLFPIKNLTLLGLSTKSFPGFTQKSGLYNEEFVSHCPNYPSLVSRINVHMSQMETLKTCSENLILSSAIMNYEGKAIEKPFEIESFLKEKNIEFKSWPIIEPDPAPLRVSNLEESLSQRLFFNEEKQLLGSVSSFENYYKNSYQYFIEKGLKVKRPKKLELDSALVGTISHDVLENTVKSYPTMYFNLSNKDVQPYLKKYVEPLNDLLKHKTEWFELVFERIENQVVSTLHKMKDYQNATTTLPARFEERFSGYTHLIPNEKIIIGGFVDRIDENETDMIVLDYKSSDQRVSDQEVLDGQKLQLITYGMILAELHQKNLVGVYYVNMSTPYPRVTLSKYSLTKGIIESKHPNDVHQSANRLKGVTFDLEQEDPLKPFIYGNYAPYDLEKTKKHFELIYQHLYDSLSSGKIAQYYDSEKSIYFELSDLERFKTSVFKTPTLSETLELEKNHLKPKKGDKR